MPLIGRKSLDKALDDTAIKLNNKLIGIYIKGLSDIVVATPVHFKDGGRLRNNWFLTEGKAGGASGALSSIFSWVRRAVGLPSTKTRGSSASGSGSFAEIGKMPDIVIGKRIFFTNNLPYANTAEYGGYPNPVETGTWTGNKYQKLSAGGYSRQAPNGMVRINIKKMEARIKKL